MHLTKKQLPFMVRVEDGPPCGAEIFFDSTGERASWEMTVRDFPVADGKKLFISRYSQTPAPAIVNVEIVLLPGMSLFGEATLIDFSSYDTNESIMQLMGYGALRKTREA